MYTKEELVKLATQSMIIYKITNTINGKVYIGQTTQTFNKRYRGAGIGAERVKHHYEYNGNAKNFHLYSAMKKYGIENFKVEIVCVCQTEKELNIKEKEVIDLYNSTDETRGYNIQIGGDNKRRGIDWRLDRLTYNENDKTFFKQLIIKKQIDKDEMFNLIYSPVTYIKKNGSTKKYYYYPNLKLCCNVNNISLEDGFCMAMRKHDGSRQNKAVYHHVSITKHEIWFYGDINIDREMYEGMKNKKPSTGRPKTKIQKPKRRKSEKTYKPCPYCGKPILSTFKKCSDCKRNGVK